MSHAEGAEPEEAVEGELTVDELATRTGTSVRTVRFYGSEGLLPPPVKRGRVAYYDNRHRMRLDLIRTMQEHGFTLAAIERVLARVPHDASAAEYAVQAAVLAPWLPGQTEELSRAELDTRAGRGIDDQELEYLANIGAVEILPGDRYRTSPAVFGHALDLLALPAPREALTESVAIIERHATAAAEGLTDLFARAVWGPYQRGDVTAEQIAEMLEHMRPLALQGLLGAFARAADVTARRRLEQ